MANTARKLAKVQQVVGLDDNHPNFDYKGHRLRLKQRFNNAPLGYAPDYELLEMLLFYIFPRRDTKPLAKALLKRFGNLKELFHAESILLKEELGMSESLVTFLRLLQDFFARVQLPSAAKGETVLTNWNAVLAYCKITMGFKQQEQLRVLYLDRKNRLLHEEVMQQGTIDRVAIYPREIAKQAISKAASAVIVVHNHPSGEVKPSPEDVAVTNRLLIALQALGIALHDHIIIARDCHYSFRANNLLDASI